jgi:phosphoketolase
VLVCHGRPDYALGLLRRIDSGPDKVRAVGYINQGGTFDTEGMLQANRCAWQHIVQVATDLLQIQG